jgi:hypothetical protein
LIDAMTEDPRFQEFGSHGVSLRDELGGIFTDERLQEWAGDSAERRNFLADTILGTISWEKTLGKPAATHLHEGFVVDHAYSQVEIEEGPEGPVTHKDWKNLDPPALWDGMEDAERYYVGFFDAVTGSLDEKIVVRLADRDWEEGEPFSGTRRVEPSELPVGEPTGRPVRLSFTVVAEPHFDAQRAGGPLAGNGGGGGHSGGSGGGGGVGGA